MAAAAPHGGSGPATGAAPPRRWPSPTPSLAPAVVISPTTPAGVAAPPAPFTGTGAAGGVGIPVEPEGAATGAFDYFA